MVMLADSEMSDFMISRSRACRRLCFDNEGSQNSLKCDKSEIKHNITDNSHHRAFLENISSILEQQKLNWNFDFENGVPMNGRYQWISVSDNVLNDTFENVGALNNSVTSSSSSFSETSIFSSIDSSLSTSSFNDENLEQSRFGKIKNKRYRQTILKDFYKTTKRNTFSSPSKLSSSSSLPHRASSSLSSSSSLLV